MWASLWQLEKIKSSQFAREERKRCVPGSRLSRNTRPHINLHVPSLHRLEVQADVQKENFPKDTASLGAISDNASTRAMAGSIISSYNPQDRYVNSQIPRRGCVSWSGTRPSVAQCLMLGLCVPSSGRYSVCTPNSLSRFLAALD